MKHLLAVLKATLLGGVIVVLPAWLAVLLVAKALTHYDAAPSRAASLVKRLTNNNKTQQNQNL
jgi:uncharacterized membrane protein